MKLSERARANGISYKTAWLRWRKGKLLAPARQTPTGTILVDVPERRGSARCCAVFPADQEADLGRQVARLAAFAGERAIKVAEVGSGLNGHRKGLLPVLRSPEYEAVVVEHRGRLVRFGSEYVEAVLAASGRWLVAAVRPGTALRRP